MLFPSQEKTQNKKQKNKTKNRNLNVFSLLVIGEYIGFSHVILERFTFTQTNFHVHV